MVPNYTQNSTVSELWSAVEVIFLFNNYLLCVILFSILMLETLKNNSKYKSLIKPCTCAVSLLVIMVGTNWIMAKYTSSAYSWLFRLIYPTREEINLQTNWSVKLSRQLLATSISKMKRLWVTVEMAELV